MSLSPPSRTSTAPVSPAKPSALQVIPPTRHTASSVCCHQGGDCRVSRPGPADWRTASFIRLSGSSTLSRPLLDSIQYIKNAKWPLYCMYTIVQNVSGYVCNHGSLRVGNETLRPLGVAMGNAVSVTRVWSIHTKTPPAGRRQPMTSLPARPQYKGAPGKYVIHFFIWSLRPKHGTAPRGRSVSFPTLREPWLHT